MLTTRYWQSEPLHCGRRAAAAVEPANLKQVQLDSVHLLRKFKFKFTGKLIPIISSFNVLSHISKSKFKNSWGFKFKTICALEAGVQTRPQHVPVIWPRTGCKPALELSSRRCCILSRGYKFKILQRHGPGARLPLTPGGGRADQMQVIWSRTGSHWLQAWLGVVVQALLFWRCSSTAMHVAGRLGLAASLRSRARQRTQQQFEMLDVRIEHCMAFAKTPKRLELAVN